MDSANALAAPATIAGTSLDAVIPTVYDELLRLAEIYLRNERSDHTLQRTALVHEAFLRLENQPNASWENRAHFLGIFSRIMRQTLTNYAIARARKKR
ncbi:MAG TPA: ECF-type sigma factor, partial [Chthoniobacterales bacterium]|nr:ECF-type sigma factor [Chthoniobacterales bacterium]